MEHPELGAEQAYIDRAYTALEEMRDAARRLGDSVRTLGAGGTFAARVERDVFVRTSAERLAHLDIGNEPLVFGRIDTVGRAEGPGGGADGSDNEQFHIGRIGVTGPGSVPMVVDWRAPVAEPFYRATGRHPLGLSLRRHFLCEGPKLLQISDEHFSERGDELGLVGTEALIAALERARTGRMRDIVATIQREQDEIIREDLPGVLVVQGGPGTGKTAVALHRAAYLLFTHRFALERDGALVVGPNQLFLRYIDQVLPALGESGVALSTVDALVGDVKVAAADTPEAARLKGDPRMAQVIANALRDRERPLPADLVVEVRDIDVRLSVSESAAIVGQIRRRRQLHNDLRSHIERAVVKRLYKRYAASFRAPRTVDANEDDFASEVVREPALRQALDRMWPRLHPWELVHDLLGARPLIDSAAASLLSSGERALLYRPWSEDPRRAPWTPADVALIDEARALLGPWRRRGRPTDEIADYGHIVVDEAQDLTPMQLRMVARRSRTGSMTVVGDVAQATGAWAPRSWQDSLAHLPDRGPVRVLELSINYRTPAEIMTMAAKVLAAASPDLQPPTSVRSTEIEPTLVAASDVTHGAALAAAELHRALDGGTVGVIGPASLTDALASALQDVHVGFGRGLDDPVALLEAALSKGLEFDGVVVVEPGRIARESPQGLHALYVALTRATQRLTVVYSEPLPVELGA